MSSLREATPVGDKATSAVQAYLGLIVHDAADWCQLGE